MVVDIYLNYRYFFNYYNLSMSVQKKPRLKYKSVRSKSQKKISHLITPNIITQQYKQKIIQIFGQIYQCQFARVILSIKGDLQKRNNYRYPNIQFIESATEGSDQQMQENHFNLSKEQIKKLIFNIKQSPQISGDFNFMLQNKGKKYKQLQQQILELQNSSNYSNAHSLWIINNYLDVNEYQFFDERVEFFFQIKRNLFTKDQQMKIENIKEEIKKQYLSIKQEKTEKKREENKQTDTEFLFNFKQLIKNSLGASMYRRNKAINPVLGKNRFSYFLVVNQDLTAEEFKFKFGCFKNYLKLWFHQVGGILHIIGFNSKGSKEKKKQEQSQKMEERIKNLQEENKKLSKKIDFLFDLLKKSSNVQNIEI